MAITDPTIDPVTGLPVLNPADVIQQIPLGVQIFPYDDLEATARPTRGPLYGDDILPVSSLTAGQHPSTGSAQTVGTDGNHRLLVSVDSSGGGGTFISPNSSLGPSNQLDDFNSPSVMVFGPDNEAALLYSVDVSVVLDPNVGGSPPLVGFGEMSFYVQDHTGVAQFYLSTLPFYWNGTMDQSVVSGHYHQDWPVGLSFAAMGMPAGFQPELWFVSQNGPYRVFGQWAWLIP